MRSTAGSWLTVLRAPVRCFLAVGLELEGVAAGDAVGLVFDQLEYVFDTELIDSDGQLIDIALC